MLPTPGDVHVNTPLTNISVAFIQDQANFVASRVFPNIPVTKQSDRYYTYDRGDWNRDEMEERAPGTESAGGGYKVDNTPTYFANVYAYHKDIPDQMRGNADAVLNPDAEATRFVTMKALIKREKLWAAKYFATTVWTNERQGVSSGVDGTEFLQWNDAASTPIEDVRAAKRTVHASTGFMPNVLVLAGHVYDKLVDHPDFVDRIKYGQTPGSPAVVNLQALAALFEVDRVLVANSIQNTAKEGLANSHSYILGKHALLVYAAPSPGLMTPTGGYTFSWTGWFGAGADGNRIKRFRMEALESDRVEIQMAFDLKLVAADLGFFFKDAVA